MSRLSIIIPVYNEKNTIKSILDKINEVILIHNIEKEIILIDDASTDGTGEILKQLNSNYKVITHERNMGKGAAIITGFNNASGDFIIIQDADMEYDPMDYNKLLVPLIEDRADVVYGSRFLEVGPHRALYFRHFLANKFLTVLSNLFTNLNLTDMETCYKVFSKKVIDDIKGKLKSNRFNIEPEITARVKKYRIYEVGVSYQGRSFEEGKKINWKDGVSAIYSIIKYNIFN